ncbi:MAG TPA: 3-oxoacyl-ACP synthase, partial [candidate division Zixibacteria bacterium]|nr:3-oxoacyl-ACP synthase [candidate division Zixibacteria bacterium]
MGQIKARIIGTGSYVPPRRLTNAEFEKTIDTSDEWIVTRTGIRERRIAANGTATSEMATEAARAALAMSDLAPDQIDLVIIGTVTPDYRVPATACLVQERLGLVNAVAFDIAAACTGFISGLTIASSFISSGQHTNALVVGAEKLSSITNWNDR